MELQAAARKGLLHLDCVSASSTAVTAQRALREAALLLQAAHGVDAETLTARLWQREQRGSTYLGQATAIPHADMWGLGRPQAAFLRLQRPCQFHRAPVRFFLVLVAPRPALAIDRAMLQHYSRLLVDAEFQARLDAAAGATDLWRAFREAEYPRDPRAGRPRAAKGRGGGPDGSLTSGRIS